MEKQNLFPILSTVKYNKINQNEPIFHKSENKDVSPSSVNQEMIMTFGGIDKTNVSGNPILNDDNDSIIDGLFEKNQILQARWKVMQKKLDTLKRDNERLTDLLSEEKTRCTKYQTKLQYIQRNQPIFEKLKQAYLSMKYNEHGTRTGVHVKERSCQTLHENYEAERACQTCEIYKEPEKTVEIYTGSNITIKDLIHCAIDQGYMPVKKKEFMAMKETVDALKSLIISQPLSSFVLSEQREAKYRKDITELFMDNRDLKQLVVDQQLELDSTKQQLAIRRTSKESNMLKKIIAKLERQIRACNICTVKLACDEDSKTDLNEKEKKIVEHIAAKYEIKLQQKQEIYELRTPTLATPYFTPRSGRTEGPETFRSCEDCMSFESI